MTAPNLEAWQQRLLDERRDLQERTCKLRDYVGSPHFGRLTEENRRMLTIQRDVMVSLVSVLNARVALFEAAQP